MPRLIAVIPDNSDATLGYYAHLMKTQPPSPFAPEQAASLLAPSSKSQASGNGSGRSPFGVSAEGPSVGRTGYSFLDKATLSDAARALASSGQPEPIGCSCCS